MDGLMDGWILAVVVEVVRYIQMRERERDATGR
jgi:hypothetical protein